MFDAIKAGICCGVGQGGWVCAGRERGAAAAGSPQELLLLFSVFSSVLPSPSVVFPCFQHLPIWHVRAL